MVHTNANGLVYNQCNLSYRKNVAEYYDPYWSKQLKRGEKVVVVRTPLGERTASQRNYAAPTSSQVQQRRHTSLAGKRYHGLIEIHSIKYFSFH